MNRAQRRKLGLKKKPDLEKKVGLFDKLPKQCTNCDKPFDKKNKEMVMSWQVIVHEKEEKVNLYCPDCWNKAQEVIHSFIEHIENKNGGEE